MTRDQFVGFMNDAAHFAITAAEDSALRRLQCRLLFDILEELQSMNPNADFRKFTEMLKPKPGLSTE